MSQLRIISADSHIFEPPDLWTSRVERRLTERVPQLAHGDDGYWWYCDGHKLVGLSSGAQAGVRFEDPSKLSPTDELENVRQGGFVPKEHVADMEKDGISVGVLYPTVGLFVYWVPDSHLVTTLFKVYNDWLAEFCGEYPEQLAGVGLLNVDDVAEGIAELERCAELGFVGCMIPVSPPPERTYDSPEYEPLWARAQALQMPLSLHIATNRTPPGQDPPDVNQLDPAFWCNTDYRVRQSLAHMILSGVFERHPNLRVGSVEMDIAWVPYFMDRLDNAYTQRIRRPSWYQFKEDMLPSDYARRNVFFSFQDDAIGIQLREHIGVDNLLWGSDYPHIESTFPRSRQILDDILSDCSEEEKAKIVGGNAARLYRLD